MSWARMMPSPEVGLGGSAAGGQAMAADIERGASAVVQAAADVGPGAAMVGSSAPSSSAATAMPSLAMMAYGSVAAMEEVQVLLTGIADVSDLWLFFPYSCLRAWGNPFLIPF